MKEFTSNFSPVNQCVVCVYACVIHVQMQFVDYPAFNVKQRLCGLVCSTSAS